jgi:hypothetical protein
MASKATLALKEASNLLLRPITFPFLFTVQRYKIFLTYVPVQISGYIIYSNRLFDLSSVRIWFRYHILNEIL